jgi:hypothetical protein
MYGIVLAAGISAIGIEMDTAALQFKRAMYGVKSGPEREGDRGARGIQIHLDFFPVERKADSP